MLTHEDAVKRLVELSYMYVKDRNELRDEYSKVLDSLHYPNGMFLYEGNGKFKWLEELHATQEVQG